MVIFGTVGLSVSEQGCHYSTLWLRGTVCNRNMANPIPNRNQCTYNRRCPPRVMSCIRCMIGRSVPHDVFGAVAGCRIKTASHFVLGRQPYRQLPSRTYGRFRRHTRGVNCQPVVFESLCMRRCWSISATIESVASRHIYRNES